MELSYCSSNVTALMVFSDIIYIVLSFVQYKIYIWSKQLVDSIAPDTCIIAAVKFVYKYDILIYTHYLSIVHTLKYRTCFDKKVRYTKTIQKDI